jgi:hypothetical protein
VAGEGAAPAGLAKERFEVGELPVGAWAGAVVGTAAAGALDGALVVVVVVAAGASPPA